MVRELLLKCWDYLSGYFTQLMFFLILLFLFRPYDWGVASTAVWEFFFTCVFISSIFNSNHNRAIKIVVCCLSAPTLILDWLTLIYPIKSLIVVSLCFTIVFLAVTTASILYNVVAAARVTLETLRGVICAYFMIGFVFAFIYLLIEFINPGSFQLMRSDANRVLHGPYLSQLMYFSYVTLLTIGFGDITPLNNISQSFVIIEGVIGQFYIAILVARIVSVYTLLSDEMMMRRLEKDIKQVEVNLQSDKK